MRKTRFISPALARPQGLVCTQHCWCCVIPAQILVFLLLCIASTHALFAAPAPAQTYDELLAAVRAAQETPQPAPGLSANQAQVRGVWTAGKLMDAYLLERSALPLALITQLSKDLNEDAPRLYYSLEFARAYPEAPPALDIPWGYYQYLLAINDPRQREQVAEKALREKWNWDKLRAEVKEAVEDNKEFVFTDTPGQTGVYRVLLAQRGPYQGQLVLDLGFSVYRLPAGGTEAGLPLKVKFKQNDLVRAQCPRSAETCIFKSAAGAETSLFTYTADVSHVIDGDTFVAVMDLGFGLTSLQTLRLWRVNAPEINTPQGRVAKKFMEDHLAHGPVLIRAMKMEKYGRYLADVWSSENNKPLYLNQALVSQGLAVSEKR